jgi:predicted secreted protein
MKRRDLFKLTSLAFGGAHAFDLNNDAIADERIRVHVQQNAVNGAVVPVGVESDIPDTLSISIYVNNHDNALVAKVDTSNKECAPVISTHMQLMRACTVTAVIETPSGIYKQSSDVQSIGQSC